MKNLLFILLVAFSSCKSNSKRTSHLCPTRVEGGYSYIQEEKFIALNEKDTVFINELKYYCVYTARLSKKVLYDRYGLWDYMIAPQQVQGPVLFWENIRVFDDDTTKYTIGAFGKEDFGYIHSSFIVLDSQGRDVLTDILELKRFKKFFGRLINLDNQQIGPFFIAYSSSVKDEYFRLRNQSQPVDTPNNN